MAALAQSDVQRMADLAGLGIGAKADSVVIDGYDPVLPTSFHIGEAASLALAEAADAAAGLSRQAGGTPGTVRTSAVDGACAIISFAVQRIDGEVIPRTNQSNPFVRPYRCGDGRWVYLHGGFPHLAAGLADLLGVSDDADRTTVGAAVEQWTGADLEREIGEQLLCGIMLRTHDEWLAHPQGVAVEALDTIVVHPFAKPANPFEPTDRARPLTGLKVLDLTRVLAGPTCGRTLAAFGADVLQVTGPDVANVPAFVIDTGHGKRRAVCDLTDPSQAAALRALALEADVVVQGYRPGVIARHGLDAASLRAAGWNGVYGSISCFGTVGPFADRAGWEQLAQSVTGIALSGTHLTGSGRAGRESSPALLPAAATDYTTGLLMAGRIMRLLERSEAGDIEASLCQTASWLLRIGADLDPGEAVGIGTPLTERQLGDFGVVDRLGFGAQVDGLDIGWEWSSHRLDRDRLRFGQ